MPKTPDYLRKKNLEQYYKHHEERIRHNREYYNKNKDKINENRRRWSKNPEVKKRNAEYARKYRKTPTSKEYWKNYYAKIRDVKLPYQKLRKKERRVEVMTYYSKGTPNCACCGITNYEFLTIDHINGGGNRHRKTLHSAGFEIVRWLQKNNYPEGFQVLCMNCNWAKGKYGKCPHNVL